MLRGQATIYVVEDDEAAREALVAWLVAQNLRAFAFSSADSFLQQADLESVGCVITDFRMPGMNGTELQSELARRASQMSIIMVSGFADVPVAVRAMQQGAVTLLEKPYNNDELLGAIDAALIRNRDARERHDVKQRVQKALSQLSDTQVQVMRLLVEGMANKSIAGQLELGLRTVERHRQQILAAMEVESLPELATLLAQVGPRNEQPTC